VLEPTLMLAREGTGRKTSRHKRDVLDTSIADAPPRLQSSARKDIC